jgi:hypothetical protein
MPGRRDEIRRTLNAPIRGKFNDAITLDDSELARLSEQDIADLIAQREADYLAHIEWASQQIGPETE